MAGFVDVVLRGLILVLTSVALGGVAWLRFVLRAEPHVKPDAPTALALRALAAAGAGAALAQATVVLVGLASVADAHGTWPLAAFFETTFALTASARVMLAAAVAALALTMTRRAAPRGAWTALAVTATLLVASSAVVSHAVARVEWRAPLIALDSAHQVAAALWVGGLAHLVLLGVAGYASPPIDVGAVARRFSTLAFRAMAAIVLAGLALTFAYVGDLAAFVGTAYGVMVLSKVALLVPALALAYVPVLGVRAARHWPLVFLGLATFLFVRNDPRAWPLGPAGFWESLTLPDVLQHRTFVLLVVAFAVFEWMVRTNRLAERPWGYVFPLLCAVGGGLLLTHSHAMFNLKEEFLTEVTHAPLGILGAFAGWGRWLEVRLPAAGRGPGWIWRGCFTAVGLILLFYREA